MSCQDDGCTADAAWEVKALLGCDCTEARLYCKEHGRAKWYLSGLVGMQCPQNRRHGASQITYHPRRIGQDHCMLCGTECPAWS